jgi:MinD superfamily P-loop ATPase
MYVPVIEEAECTGCKECAKICPKMVFETEDSEIIIANPIYCTGCESCSAVCPTRAIEIQEV